MDELVKYLAQGGGVGLLVLFILALYSGKLLFGKQCDDRCKMLQSQLDAMMADRDEWKGLSLTLLGQSTKAVDLAHHATLGEVTR